MKTLLILPTLVLSPGKNGKHQITKKFVDGIMQYKQYWHGEIEVLMRVGNKQSTNLDAMDVDYETLPFKLDVIQGQIRAEDLKSASIVLASGTHENNNVSALCQSLNIPCVYITEYSLKTNFQIINTFKINFLLKLRKWWWLLNQEFKLKKALKKASGIQCNGTPTYEAYRKLNSKALLYFDNRIPLDKFISLEHLNTRFKYLDQDTPLRLAFSGRLIEIKGADHLIKVAIELKRLNTPFTMSIFGSGQLSEKMTSDIAAHGLTEQVKLEGILNFETELLPRVQNSVDLFVCCHRQGDPSCTYIETLACGVPIVGYANEAFAGILKYAEIGLSAPMNDYLKLAGIINNLAEDRDRLKNFGLNALFFAKEHSVENVFIKRIKHLDNLLPNET